MSLFVAFVDTQKSKKRNTDRHTDRSIELLRN